MAKRLSRIERDIERLKEKISEYQQQLKELEAEKTEQENLQIIQRCAKRRSYRHPVPQTGGCRR